MCIVSFCSGALRDDKTQNLRGNMFRNIKTNELNIAHSSLLNTNWCIHVTHSFHGGFLLILGIVPFIDLDIFVFGPGVFWCISPFAFFLWALCILISLTIYFFAPQLFYYFWIFTSFICHRAHFCFSLGRHFLIKRSSCIQFDTELVTDE